MGITKDKHIEHMNEVDFAEEVQKDLAEQSKFFAERQSEKEREVPQHIIDEELADSARQRTRDLRQMEMYDDEMWNWSGLR